MISMEKRELIYSCIRLGMEKEKAYIIACLSEKEIQETENNPELQERFRFYECEEERKLLAIYKREEDNIAKKGNLKPIQWKLERINPGRWGNRSRSTNININKDYEKATQNLDADDIARLEKEFQEIVKAWK